MLIPDFMITNFFYDIVLILVVKYPNSASINTLLSEIIFKFEL